ncbi:hypothetical protein RVV18_001997 [Burkholderia ambifaria]|jgi:hypothetical protein|nr:hypothetical protein [Burkholderia ambifaria]ELK6206574.1 hypothetical protein [Burkholderia ambifaria]MBR7929613.1 hypothetical protein [Burkholderia ambifaria]MBR8347303.1 hypothetical protein [Burkholderia ambifaria]QQC02915.1 hypothetical protein I6H84_08885 [Burkholderia ambifaria]UZU06330.1 hypothetical protein OR987_23325 [Burkholderia ambifaria]
MKTIWVVTGLLSLSGCASIIDGSTQVVSVETRSAAEAVTSASCKLTNDKGTWFVTTPGSVSLHRSMGDLNIKCDKEGREPGISTVASSARGMVAGNLLFGGIVGTAIDMGTGAAYDYPTLITVSMGAAKMSAAPAAASGAPSMIPTSSPAPSPVGTAAATPVAGPTEARNFALLPSCSTITTGPRVNCTIP